MAFGKDQSPGRRVAKALCVLSILSGCASDGGQCPATLSNPYPSPAAMRALASDQVPLGQHLTWGGIFMDARHLSDATELVISARPLDSSCQVRRDAPAQGRFLVRYPGYFETTELISGQPLRVSGRLAAVETQTRSGEPMPVVTETILYGIRRPGAANATWDGYRPRISIGVGAGSGWSGGGVGISF
ncbi:MULTISPECIES: Slp family lipoprotein [Thiorhodovibrio]|uniref:Slp family lipoprotein n=1 Tax=Thiorhodovibrio TaxID=61593 RepID=UPI00191174CB|nr:MULTISPECIES: Slp family lipoprotein [Thiorhodovibrio]WPL10739.1 outer membrane lipoprotein, Slp family [Thiorhodovibrio litoralis]